MPGIHPKTLSHGLGLATLLFFALALAVPSGYSWGAALAAVLALAGSRHWARQKQPRRAVALAGLFVFLGLVAQHDFDGWLSFSRGDLWLKYALAAMCMLCVHHVPVRTAAIRAGLVAGLALALALAAWQVLAQGMPRATGFTNAIQFGGMAAGFALVAACVGAAASGAWRWALAAAAAAGAAVSVLSMSRGGWPLLLLIAPLWLALGAARGDGRTATATAAKGGGRAWRRLALVLGCNVAVVAAIAMLPTARDRMNLIQAEVGAWQNATDAAQVDTSIGQRLEQWRLAAALIRQKPLAGHGRAGLMQAKRAAVANGTAHASVLHYDHAHNDLLQAWAQRGLLGVAALAALYGLPVALLWPTAARHARIAPENRRQWLALRTAAVTVPLSCAACGLTQTFFAHNSGHFFYAFTLVFLVGAAAGLEGERPPPPQAG